MWKKWKRFNTVVLIIPMSIQLVVYSILSCVFRPNEKNVDENLIFVFELASAVIALYFLIIETMVTYGLFKTGVKMAGTGELILNFLSPTLILVTQFVAIFLNSEDYPAAQAYYWEVLAWTSFFLWYRFLLMLRSVRWMSPAISMVLACLKEIWPYFVILMVGVFAFTDAFQSMDQIAYKKSKFLDSDDDKFKRSPVDKTESVDDISSFFRVYLGEWLHILKSSFIGSVIGFEGEGTELWSESQYVLYLVCIIFNAIVLMNVLLALVGEIFGQVYGQSAEHTYQQLVNQICQLQRISAMPQKRNSLAMAFMASQRQDVGKTDSENVKGNKEDEKKKLDTLRETLFEVQVELHEVLTKTDKLSQKEKKRTKKANEALGKGAGKPSKINPSPMSPTKPKTPKELTIAEKVAEVVVQNIDL